MSALIEYYEERTGRYRAIKFTVPPPKTKEEAEAILRKFKVKASKVVGFQHG